MPGNRTLILLYPGCVVFEVMLAAELLHHHFPVDVATPDGADHLGSNGLTVRAQWRFEAVPVADYRCVLVPGGDPYALLANRAVETLLQKAQEQEALIGAICAGPLLLAKSGLLQGRSFTHGYGDHFQDVLAPYWQGAQFVDEPLVVDGPIVTAQPQAHVDFAVEIARRLATMDDERAERQRAFYKGKRPADTKPIG